MAGQIPGGADDAPDLAIAELSEETTPPLCSLRRWLWVWDRRQWPPRPFGRHFSPHLCVLFEICPRLTTSACLVSFALCGSSLAVGCLCALRRLPLVVFCVTGHLTGLVMTSVGTVVAVSCRLRVSYAISVVRGA